MISFFNAYSGLDLLVVLIAYVVALVTAFTLHEFAHAFVAHKQGDMTPKSQGRLTLNPLSHIDPLGFLLILFVGFGWAKPVQVNPIRFRNYKKGMFLVSIAGVFVNLILAFTSYPIFLLLSKLSTANYLVVFLQVLFQFTFLINSTLFVFNLLPVYPLDGFRVIETFAKYDNKYVQFNKQYGSFMLLALILVLNFTSILELLITAFSLPISIFWNLIFGLF